VDAETGGDSTFSILRPTWVYCQPHQPLPMYRSMLFVPSMTRVLLTTSSLALSSQTPICSPNFPPHSPSLTPPPPHPPPAPSNHPPPQSPSKLPISPPPQNQKRIHRDHTILPLFLGLRIPRPQHSPQINLPPLTYRLNRIP
jgi:hypothetical protein